MEKGNYKGDESLEKKKIEQHGLFIETIINEYTDEQQNGFVMDLLSRIADFRQRRREKLEQELNEIGDSVHELKQAVGSMLGFIDLSDMPNLPRKDYR